jgi:hypothetical protein
LTGSPAQAQPVVDRLFREYLNWAVARLPSIGVRVEGPGALVELHHEASQGRSRCGAARRGAAYIYVVKRNQPTLYRQLKTLPWAKPARLPHATQAIRLTRKVRNQRTGIAKALRRNARDYLRPLALLGVP